MSNKPEFTSGLFAGLFGVDPDEGIPDEQQPVGGTSKRAEMASRIEWLRGEHAKLVEWRDAGQSKIDSLRIDAQALSTNPKEGDRFDEVTAEIGRLEEWREIHSMMMKLYADQIGEAQVEFVRLFGADHD